MEKERNAVGIYYLWFDDSHLQATHARNIAIMQQAGINVAACAWLPPGCGEIDNNLKGAFIPAAEATGIQFCIHSGVDGQDPYAAYTQLAYIWNQYAHHPLYFHIDGKPVVFLYCHNGITNAAYSTVQMFLERQGMDFCLIADLYTRSNAETFNGICQYSGSWEAWARGHSGLGQGLRELFQQAKSIATGSGKLLALPAYARYFLGITGPGYGGIDGVAFCEFWRLCNEFDPDLVMMIMNEGEGDFSGGGKNEHSGILPDQCGTDYLMKLAKAYTTAWKNKP